MSFALDGGPVPERPAPTTRFGRLLRFCLDQMSGMRISFGSGGHEQKLTLTFSFLSSLVASVIFLTVLWACGAGWFASGDRYTQFWGQTSILGDGWFAWTARVIASTLLTLGAWLIAVGEAVGAALLVFLATASVGAVVGFLFGVPRPLSESGPGAASAAAAASSNATPPAGSGAAAAPAQTAVSTPASAAGPGWYANTNLTQVSDWLTKIIVGVGLVEASRVGAVAQKVNTYIVPKLLGGFYGAALVAPALMIIGLIVGFMYCYLFTQLFLAALMAQAAEAIRQNIDLFETNPLASAELSRIPAAAPVVAPAIRVPGSAAPVREPPDATREQMTAAVQVQTVPLTEINDVKSLAIWARASAVLNEYGPAVAGYVKLLAKERTPGILAEAARVFASANDFAGARKLIDEAFSRRSAADPATRGRIAFDAAHLALYDTAPDGYQSALSMIADSGMFDHDGGGGLHVLHACALGQQYRFETALSPDEKAKIRQTVLDDLRTALDNSANRPWILYLLGRNSDGTPRTIKPGPNEDDDLFPFKDDKEFLDLVGVKP